MELSESVLEILDFAGLDVTREVSCKFVVEIFFSQKLHVTLSLE
jgi:hypothetical protein